MALYIQYGLPFMVALGLALLLTPIVRIVALRYKWVADPSQERWHKNPRALFGGVAIFFSFMVPCAIYNHDMSVFRIFLLGGISIFALGIIDDTLHITPYAKLIGQIMVASLLVIFGVRLEIVSYPLVTVPITILWLVGLMNAFNLLDNMDGLSAGVAAISSFIIFLYSIINNSPHVALMSLLILGSTLGFLRYNFNPAKIFMGDCGSMFLGYALGAIAILGTSKAISNVVVTLSIPILVLAVPIFDTIFVTFARKFNDRPISQGGKDHTSHRLVALGMTERQAVLTLYLISFLCGMGGLLYTRMNKLILSIAILLFVICLILFGVFLGDVKVYSRMEDLEKEKGKRKKNGRVLLNDIIIHKRRIMEVVIDFAIICIAYVSSFLLRYEGALSATSIHLIMQSLPLIIIIRFTTFAYFGLYRGVWKYIGLHDLISIFKAVTTGTFISMVALLLFFRFEGYSRAIIVIEWMTLLIFISGVRILLRVFREFFISKAGGRRVLIIGAGDAGELLLREMKHNNKLGYKPVGFIDDNPKKHHKSIHGIPVLGSRMDMPRFVQEKRIEEVLIAIPSHSDKMLEGIFQICREHSIPFKHISSIMSL
ncbi:MAG: hypothetical protein HQ593_01565 [Candidatus Omnitrophica bacterium]|nr:hypothetical protein [Candidatus Omnitrophota bacterium]